MELTGKIKLINETQTFDSGFTKREFVVTTNEQYPQDIKCEVVKDKCEVLNSYNVGDNVTVGINLRGNEYNGRYFVNIQAWRIEKTESTPVSAPANEEVVDDLPF